MAHYYEEALEKHQAWKGKISVEVKAPLNSREDLSLAYTPGVAAPCLEIAKDRDKVYDYTWKGNTVAIISDGTAVLGLGDIGPEAALPVMEGKAALFKRFAGVNAVPVVLDTKDPKEIIDIVKRLAPTFGGINLEDISAPRCVEIERALVKALDIPIFHDDQHGTAIVVTAAVFNALKLVKKKAKDTTLVVSGTGAAGSSVIRMMEDMGVGNIYAFNINGILRRDNSEALNFVEKEVADLTNSGSEDLSLKEALKKADIFIGVSAPGIVTREMALSMKKNAILFALANPEPEISYEDAKAAGVRVAGTGRSDFPNQVNNVLAFPGLFKGALKVRAGKISEGMKLAAAMGLASLVSENELSEEYVIPGVFDERVADVVAEAVARKAVEEGLSRLK